jgi:Alginate lyase
MKPKKSLPILAVAIAILFLHSLPAQSLVHPGVLVSRAQLDFVKAQIQSKTEPVYTQFLHAQSSVYGDLNYKVKGPPPDGVIACGPYSHPDQGCRDEDEDASAAYLQSLLWYFTGNHAYAQNAIDIMNAYSHRLRAYTLSNAPLQAAWGAEKWPRAAEIIRYSNAGWSSADIQAFSRMLTTIELPLIHDGSPSNGNWELSMIEGMMGIAVFTDDRKLLDHAAGMWHERVPAYFYYAPADGDHPVAAPRGVVHWLTQSTFDARVNGIPQEACRDFGHTSYGVSATMAAAETAHIQGLKLYEAEEPRLIAALEFVSYYLLRNPVPPYVCDGSVKLAKGITFVIGYNEFHNRLGQSLPNTEKWIETGVLPSDDPVDDHTTIFEALTHYADASATSPPRPMPLSANPTNPKTGH